MQYFKVDVQTYLKNKMIIAVTFVLLLVSVASPISTYYINAQWDGFAKEIGENPFQFWLLMDSVGWGHAVYHALFWVLPVLLTGLVYYNQKSSSIYELLIVRGNRKQYFLSKVFCQFLFSFVIVFGVLSINVIVTYLIYPIDAPMTEQYMYLIPQKGMFALWFYEVNPLYMVFLYVFLNAIATSLLSILVLAIHELFTFKNVYMAFLVPFISIFVGYYLISMLLGDNQRFDLGIILQPRSVGVLADTIYAFDVVLVFLALFILDIALLIIGYMRNEEVC